MAPSTWLRYWRNSLADIDRKQIDIKEQNVLTQTLLTAEARQRFYAQHQPAPVGSADPEPLDVVLAPFTLRAAGSYNRRTVSAAKTRQLHPFWVPARLTQAGELLPPMGDEPVIPWLVRDVLEPAARDAPVLGTIEAVDAAITHWQWKNTQGWDLYWADAEAFYARCTGTNGWPADRATLGDWSAERAETLTLAPSQGMAERILDLYQYLEKRPTLPRLLTTLVQGRAVGPPLDPDAPALLLIKGHYGQMSGNFPLSASQRATLQMLLTTAPGDVFPVNGPPGTGKTTLLQSIVANLLVEKALLGQEAPRILASSTNNQAITNILDSFGREARVTRWVPELASLGLFLKNTPTEADTRNYQLHSKKASFYQTKEGEDGRYLQAAQVELLRQGAAYFGKSFSTPAALRDELHQALLRQKASIDAWLNLLPRLLDEHGRPWQAETLQRDLLAARAQVSALEAFQLAVMRLQASESSFDTFLASFLSSVRQKQRTRYLLLVRELCPYPDEVTDYDPEPLKLGVAQRLASAQQRVQRLHTGLASLAAFDQLAGQLRRDYPNLPTEVDYLQALSAADFTSVHDALDVTHRHTAFQLALHYWEARYVLALHERLRPARPSRQKFERKTEQYARWAMLTPCFIATFHSVAGFMGVKDENKENGYALELFDLLLVDEAGQVSPEVGAAAFALARKAVVVGDTFQIEPVWGLGAALDAQNQRRAGLNPADCPEAGQVSAGSLMRLAQEATPLQLANYPQARGLLLRQHRRCKPEIIRYCDEFVYGGQLERKSNPSDFASVGLPPLGYLHIAGECISAGGSHQNPQEAQAIARWLSLKKEDLLAAARRKAAAGTAEPRLQDIVGVVTPFGSQRNAINQALREYGLEAENITVGTVHALQGAERPIVLFSSVYDARHRGGYFFDRGYNLLNVAVSRAREAFIVVGNRCLFNPSLNTASGNLAKLLFEEPTADDQPRHELDNSFFYGDESRRHLPVPREHLGAVAQGKVNRLSELKAHRDALAWAINTAEKHLVIVSPFISVRAIQADGLADLIVAAKARRPALRIIVYTDAHLDAPHGQLHAYTLAGREALVRAGAEVKIAAQIHNKTVCFDNNTLFEGSFNWLSASRSETLARHEVSWFFRGEAWAGCIGQLVQEMESRVVSSLVV